jgi:antitoxin component YwqK of YwqJK toxin-antitoxin module
LYRLIRQILKYLVLLISILLLEESLLAAPRPQKVAHRSIHANGKLHHKGHFVNDQKHGIWFEYNEHGVLQQKTKWKYGITMWEIHYNEVGRVIKTVNKKGEEKIRPACGC